MSQYSTIHFCFYRSIAVSFQPICIDGSETVVVQCSGKLSHCTFTEYTGKVDIFIKFEHAHQRNCLSQFQTPLSLLYTPMTSLIKLSETSLFVCFPILSDFTSRSKFSQIIEDLHYHRRLSINTNSKSHSMRWNNKIRFLVSAGRRNSQIGVNFVHTL